MKIIDIKNSNVTDKPNVYLTALRGPKAKLISKANIFGHLWEKSTGDRWIPFTKATNKKITYYTSAWHQ